MSNTLIHRGPDSAGYFVEDNVALGFRRLAIVDLEHGAQPMYNEDRSLVLICNGEIYNHSELRRRLEDAGHIFQTQCDVEVLLHLYEERGSAFLNSLNGQFALALYDRDQKSLFLARDHCGINPLYYTRVCDTFIFGSEIKAILAHPLVEPKVDLTGLDQTLSLPGLVSPRTMFENIFSLKPGHFIEVGITRADVRIQEYWDLEYPPLDELAYGGSEHALLDELESIFEDSVRRRLSAHGSVGYYLSGGVDSSLIATLVSKLSPRTQPHSFSITFETPDSSEGQYQQMVAAHVKSIHHSLTFGWSEISRALHDVIFHCECPLKETFNTCALALSNCVRSTGHRVILSGEGCDELFAGYVGYRFDQARQEHLRAYDLDTVLEEEMRQKLWGDKAFFYEIDENSFRDVKRALYSDAVNERYSEFDFTNFEVVNKKRLVNRHVVHQRSYLDFKLRLADHLLADHGDKMSLANSVEARYPFLDINLVNFARRVPPDMKVRNLVDKYLIRRLARKYLPVAIAEREKFGFHAPGSPYLLKNDIEWINCMLSNEKIKRDGYFNPATVARLRAQYAQDGFQLNVPYENDLLTIVLTFGMLLDIFKLPRME